jgi:hypothetical protein
LSQNSKAGAGMTQYTKECSDFSLYFHGVGTAGNFNAHNLVSWAKLEIPSRDSALVEFITTECTKRGFEAYISEQIAPLNSRPCHFVIQDELDRDDLLLELVLMLKARMMASRGVLS